MIGGCKPSLRVAVVGALLVALLLAGRARADSGVSIRYESDDQLDLARRVASELASEGYAVDIGRAGEPSPCDPNGPRLLSVPRGTKTWIRLTFDPSDPDTIVASICHLGAQPLLQQAAPRAPRAEASQLALATAEALNGLRSKLPPLESAPERTPPRKEPASRVPPEEPPAALPQPPEFVNRAVFGAAFVWNLPDFPATSGATGRATLGLVPGIGIVMDAFVPIHAREVESEVMTARLRTSWLRIGPSIDAEVGDIGLSGAALAGPALTWATADASPPRVGTTDVTTGAVLTLGVLVEYPREGGFFASASAAASALFPGVDVNLGDDTRSPRGSWPVEATVGFGARWGAAAR